MPKSPCQSVRVQDGLIYATHQTVTVLHRRPDEAKAHVWDILHGAKADILDASVAACQDTFPDDRVWVRASPHQRLFDGA